MFILDLVNNCGNPALSNLFYISQKFIIILQILVPILAIYSLIINLVRSVQNPDDKKTTGRFKHIFHALLFVFAIPVLVDATMGMLGEDYSISACWNYASQTDTRGDSTYKPVNDKKPSGGVNTDPSEYDQGSASTYEDGGSDGEEAAEDATVGNGSVIMIGDSRCVQMKNHVGEGNNTWSCKGSMGLNWMKSTGVPNIESKIGNGTKIVIMMGVNDLYQVDAYITYLNSMANTWVSKGAKVYFVSVNPCDGSYNSLNTKITNFNNSIKSGINSNIRYIDTHTYLTSGGFTTSDGLHYTKETSRKIYNYIISNI